MTSFKIYMLLLFGISVILYLFGYSSPLLQLVANTGAGTDMATTLVNALIGMFSNPLFLAALGAASVVSYLTGGNDVAVTYLVPIFIIIAMANFFILPMSFINAVDIDPLLRLIVLGFMNLLLGLSIVDFVRGG